MLTETIRGPGGFLDLYSGFKVSIVGIIPFRAAYFVVHDTLGPANPWSKDGGARGLISKFIVAQTAAVAAGFASYPFDTVRRRLAAQAKKPPAQRRYQGTIDCFVKIVEDEGFGALFKGAGFNALRAVLSALTLAVYTAPDPMYHGMCLREAS